MLLIPSSDYLGHPFPQRHNQIFERLHDGKEFEVHVVRFGFFGKPKLKTKCAIYAILPRSEGEERGPQYARDACILAPAAVTTAFIIAGKLS